MIPKVKSLSMVFTQNDFVSFPQTGKKENQTLFHYAFMSKTYCYVPLPLSPGHITTIYNFNKNPVVNLVNLMRTNWIPNLNAAFFLQEPKQTINAYIYTIN